MFQEPPSFSAGFSQVACCYRGETGRASFSIVDSAFGSRLGSRRIAGILPIVTVRLNFGKEEVQLTAGKTAFKPFGSVFAFDEAFIAAKMFEFKH